MRRTLVRLVALAALSAALLGVRVYAQDSSAAKYGDPPIAALINVSATENDFVVVNGAVGSVFPAAQVAVRNMYSGDTVYTLAGITGSFTATIFGTEDTPYWISVAPNIPQEIRDQKGSLPGGPGTIIYGLSDGDATSFVLTGTVGRGAGRWTANGRISALTANPGDVINLRLDVRLQSAVSATDLDTIRMIGQVGVQPISGDTTLFATGGRYGNNGWSGTLTSSGMPIVNLNGDLLFSEFVVSPDRISRDNDVLEFEFDFDLRLPDDVPVGLYTPYFEGFVQVGEDEPKLWSENTVLGTGIDDVSPMLSRLPIVLNIGNADGGRLLWTLMQDVSSDGSRGILASEDRENVGLSNRVRYDSPTFIVPPFAPDGVTPIAYSLEPYSLQMLANDYQFSVTPLLPLRLPGGSITVQVTHPDSTVDRVGTFPFMQNRLSSSLLDEQALFGTTSVVDAFQLTTLRSEISQYVLTDYGAYEVRVSGYVDDVFDNRYEGGGTYTLLAAEQLDLTPGVLSGTPFEIGNVFNPGLHVSPAVPAGVSVHIRLYPLDGSEVIEKTFVGEASANGVFYPRGETFAFDQAGEYVIDYEARYTDDQGRLWAGSLRSAGVIATPGGVLIAHGRRGVEGDESDTRQAWFNARQFDEINPTIRFPYNSGDVVWAADGRTGGIQPTIRIQDTSSLYASWLAILFPLQADALNRQAVLGELPVSIIPASTTSLLTDAEPISEGYSYISAVRPSVTTRQMIIGSENGLLALNWTLEDVYNQQIGAGIIGDQPGDFQFLFGGVVVKNTSIAVREAAIYASLLLPIDPVRDVLGERVYPPYRGEAGGANGGALFTLYDEPIDMFFHLTGTQPGDVLFTGDTLVISGQAAPTLDSKVEVIVTAPDGQIQQFEGRANAIGYYYDPTKDIVLDQAGMWKVDVRLIHDSQTSAGIVQSPYPVGGVLGAEDYKFPLYVLPRSALLLEWPTEHDIEIPSTLAYNASFGLPQDWNDIDVRYTTTIPGYLVSSGTLNVSGRSFTYQYNPFQLDSTLPNWESSPTAQGPASSDVVTITLVASGTDAQGERQYRYRLITIRHDRLLTLE